MVHRFAAQVMRLIGQQLDRMTPEEVIAESSPLWSVFKAFGQLGLGVDGVLEFEPEQMARMLCLVFEELGWGDAGLAISLGSSMLPRLTATKFGNQFLLERTPESMIGCWGATEPEHGSDVLDANKQIFNPQGNYGRPDCVAKLYDDKVVINGRKSDWISNLTELERAAQVLKGTGLQAVPQEDGKAVVLWEYRQVDISPYNKVAVTVLAVAPLDPAPAIYVADLPVTTEAANRAGQELWGYNKFVTNIEIKGDGKQFSAIVHDPQNVLISSLEGTRGVSVPVAPTDIYSFSLLEKKIIKTFVQVPTPWHASNGEGFVLRVRDSNHRMAGHLRALGLDGAHPALVQNVDPFLSLLFPGTAL